MVKRQTGHWPPAPPVFTEPDRVRAEAEALDTRTLPPVKCAICGESGLRYGGLPHVTIGRFPVHDGCAEQQLRHVPVSRESCGHPECADAWGHIDECRYNSFDEQEA